MAASRAQTADAIVGAGGEPALDCGLCPRLAAFREANRREWPEWHNAPVQSLGPLDARLLIVGLAPGLRGANRTGRPFTGDYAGVLLYRTLIDFGFARGEYAERADDGLTLVGCRIANAVRCLPPQNKPLPAEINACRPFLSGAIAALPRLRAVVTLGRVSHDSTLKALGLRLAAHPFAHGAAHRAGALTIFDSYHCSRYNTNTGVLTEPMFRDVFAQARRFIDAQPA